MRWISLMVALCFMFMPLLALAEGEDDILWKRSNYEKKVFEVGQRILQANGIQEKISFRIERDYNVNASASRGYGNTVDISKGLLNFIENDDELAAVLGHEINHILRRHGRKTIIKRTGFVIALAALGGEPNPTRAAKWVLTSPSGLGPFEKMYETESDLKGIDLMARAGYNPLAAEGLMTKIAGDRSWYNAWEPHPKGSTRIRNIRRYIAAHYPQFLTPELAKDWTLPDPQLPGTVYYNPPDNNSSPDADKTSQKEQEGLVLSSSSQTESAILLQQLAETGSAGKVSDNNKNPPDVKSSSSKTRTSTTSLPVAENPQSLVKILLTLDQDHLTVLKALEERGYMEEEHLQEDYLQNMPEEHSEAILLDLAQKRLIRIAGDEPERIFILSDWVAEEFKTKAP